MQSSPDRSSQPTSPDKSERRGGHWLGTHEEIDQFLFFVQGKVEAILNGESKMIDEGDAVFVSAGTEHNFKNVGQTEVRLFTVYSPPEHPDGTTHQTKAEAESAEHH